ncbi:hypothetical protein D3H64_08725 [Atopobacter sp. AH10]|uniref:hypothetical protein n=1 Tax=Atopobacter sp. AH10 TaxID=2315861 RepID=UPI000EF253B3|nr:hypothetical protein [Atopobacter sp. AH10]RLK62627.1 hypothetical protein D3H64_08725 [Atopobacter sp. AH10]
MDVILTATLLEKVINSGVASKAFETIRTLKASGDNKRVIEEYENIFSQLISENQELKNIALEYKEAYESVNLTDEDISYLQTTVRRVIELLGIKGENKPEGIDALINLIQVDTLRTMQLLGFNYKQAIGIPLTEITAEYIRNSLKRKNSQYRNQNSRKRC